MDLIDASNELDGFTYTNAFRNFNTSYKMVTYVHFRCEINEIDRLLELFIWVNAVARLYVLKVDNSILTEKCSPNVRSVHCENAQVSD